MKYIAQGMTSYYDNERLFALSNMCGFSFTLRLKQAVTGVTEFESFSHLELRRRGPIISSVIK